MRMLPLGASSSSSCCGCILLVAAASTAQRRIPSITPAAVHAAAFVAPTSRSGGGRGRRAAADAVAMMTTRATAIKQKWKDDDAAAIGCTTGATLRAGRDEAQQMQYALYRIRACNHLPDDIRKSLLEFRLPSPPSSSQQSSWQVLGKVRPTTAQLLCSTQNSETPVFRITQDNGDDSKKYLTLAESLASADSESRSKAVASVMEQLRDSGRVLGWRDELYPVGTSFYKNQNGHAAFDVERAAVPFLGAIEYGVHINGIVGKPPLQRNDNTAQVDGNNNSRIQMWMARRSATKSKFPGMLDHVVAGGQPVGMSLFDNVLKECQEEAGIPPDLVRQGLRNAGAVSYEHYHSKTETVSRCVLFCYDLYLPEEFVPTPTDGEVDEFFLWSVDELLESLSPNCDDPIKPNCYLVVIDFLLRHGYLNPDVPGYLDVLRELRNGQCC